METVAGHVVVKKSRPGLGQGLFAARALRAGDFVAEYSGKRIPTQLADTLKSRYLFEIDSKWTIDAEQEKNFARYINHSCEPNAEARIESGHVMIYAAKHIERGEEITVDYGEEYFDEFIRPVGCQCSRCVNLSKLAETNTKY